MVREDFTLVALTFFGKVKGFILNPIETFKRVREENIVFPVKYYISLNIVSSTLGGIIFFIFSFSPFYSSFNYYRLSRVLGGMNKIFEMDAGTSTLILIIIMIISGIINLFIGGAWLHLWIRLFGGKEKYYQTIKAIAYGNTPNLLLGWLPFIGLAGVIWSFVLVIIGIKEYHEMNVGKVLLVLIVSGIMMTMIVSAIIFLIFTLFFSLTG